MPERGATCRVVAALCVLASAGGCAPTMPSWSGARTTPSRRFDLAAGAAVRVPLEALRASNASASDVPRRTLEVAAGGGAAPGASARAGLGDAVDLGLRVLGSTAQLELRGAVTLNDSRSVRLLVGIAPFGGAVADRESSHAWRAGAELPVTIGYEIGGLYELAVGARMAGERIVGELSPVGGPASALAAWHWRVGAVLGIGVGFRRLFVFVELAADYEWLVATVDAMDASASGVSLTPAFALRWRF